ncbi:polysaccharide pyruvyl transferase family protein [Streptomyces sp. NPDC002793]|uniref:polysaccharide pyruvyl transferase family protein n=1 Tax=Streptomyces sp. NPDC002793 TaxID=3154432 RepID=UPI00333392AE
MAQRAVSAALERLRISHDTAWSPRFAPGALTLATALPCDYSHLLFVCGPLHGKQIAALHHRYASCRRVAVGVSVIARDDPAVSGFHRVSQRDGPDSEDLPDLATAAPATLPVPLVGVALTHGQGEYRERRLHGEVATTVLPWLAGKDCARIDADTRLGHGDWRRCETPDQYLSLLGRLDLMVTDRLHGLVLSLRAGVPVLAVDPVKGGAKVMAQARLLHWPAALAGETLSVELLDRWWDWCRSPEGTAAARRRSVLLERAAAAEHAADS